LLRRWLEVDEQRRASKKSARALHDIHRQLSFLRGVVQQQGEYTVEALERAGWMPDEHALEQKGLQRALRTIQGKGDVLVGPWTGEVGFELLYWIPFLNWLASQGLDGRRLVVVSRGGAAPWYRHLTSRYVDVLDLVSPEDFLRRTSEERKRKQNNPKRSLDVELVARVRERLGLPDAEIIHPSAMFRLFKGLWRGRATIDLVQSFTMFQPMVPLPADEIAAARAKLPDGCVVAKFYFSRAFPDTSENRAFVGDLLRNVSRQIPVALMSTSVRLDDHEDFSAAASSGLHVVDPHTVPQRNLAYQTALISGARGFLGTYGGFSYLAPFYGVRSVSFFSRRRGFEQHHLDLADRVFDRVMPGGFVALDCRAFDLVQTAVTGWGAPPRRGPHPSDEAIAGAAALEKGAAR
jgi:hypothetical protein